MTKKVEWIALFIMVIDHYLYDWAILYVPDKFDALFASSWNLTFYGYIGLRLIDDAINNPIKLERQIKWTIAVYFIWRTMVNTVAFMQSFQLEGSWGRYKIITSNTFGDGLIWIIITIILIKITHKHLWSLIKRICQRRKIT